MRDEVWTGSFPAEGVGLVEVSLGKRLRLVPRREALKEIPAEKLLGIFRDMVRTRALDEKINELLSQGHSIGQHPTTGQEAGPVAACAVLREGDYIMPYHRGWAWAIGKGMDPARLLAELLGKKTGYCRGKGGPHLADWDLGILGRSGVQGAHIPVAAGVGLSIKRLGQDRVCICFFGNGASNTGNFHEGLNLAAVWKVPVVFFCENNLYAIFSTAPETTAVTDLADRAGAYGMPGYIVDGNDAVAIYRAVRAAVERARAGGGPTLIESKTYRWSGHNPIDRIHYGGYRPKEEVDSWRERCPIRRLREDLLQTGLASPEQLDAVAEEAKREMERAAEAAVAAPYPEPSDYLEDVYA